LRRQVVRAAMFNRQNDVFRQCGEVQSFL
jgi:hypothetical protein